MEPLVSICIPTYNGESFIKDSMDSILELTYQNLEIIISDDASEDNTLQIIDSYKTKINKPFFIYHHGRKGIGANWNNCIRHSNGKYIKFLFQDDVLEAECIEKMVKILEHDECIGLVASKRDFIVEEIIDNEETRSWIKTFRDLQVNLNLVEENGVFTIDKKLFRSSEFLNSKINNKIGEPSTFMFRKALLEKTGLFREDLKQVLDYEFCYRILKKNKIAIINEALVKFRLHHSQATQINLSKGIEDYKKFNRLIYDDYFWYLNSSKRWELLKMYNPFIKFFVKINLKLKHLIK